MRDHSCGGRRGRHLRARGLCGRQAIVSRRECVIGDLGQRSGTRPDGSMVDGAPGAPRSAETRKEAPRRVPPPPPCRVHVHCRRPRGHRRSVHYRSRAADRGSERRQDRGWHSRGAGISHSRHRPQLNPTRYMCRSAVGRYWPTKRSEGRFPESGSDIQR